VLRNRDAQLGVSALGEIRHTLLARRFPVHSPESTHSRSTNGGMRRGRWIQGWAIGAFALGSVGCGSDTQGVMDADVPAAESSGSAGDSVSPQEPIDDLPIQAAENGSNYPVGPYGANNPSVGDVVEDLQLRGLLNWDAQVPSSDLDVEDHSLATFRSRGRTHLLLTTSTAWCGSCQAAAKEMGTELAAEVQQLTAAGGAIVGILLEGLTREPPTDDELNAWARSAGLEASVMGATSDGRTTSVFPEREWAYILRLDTMQVVWRQQVALYATPTSSRVGLDQLKVELGL
jgi:hypothetical protein